MSVHILFADGSRQMSHNLDDRRERWELRKEVTEEVVVEESNRGYEVPRLDAFDDYDAMMQMCDVYSQMIVAATFRITLTNDRRALRPYRALMVGLREEVTGQRSHLRGYIKRMNIDRNVSDEQARFALLKDYARDLERRLMEWEIELPPRPYANWKTVVEIEALRDE